MGNLRVYPANPIITDEQIKRVWELVKTYENPAHHYEGYGISFTHPEDFFYIEILDYDNPTVSGIVKNVIFNDYEVEIYVHTDTYYLQTTVGINPGTGLWSGDVYGAPPREQVSARLVRKSDGMAIAVDDQVGGNHLILEGQSDFVGSHTAFHVNLYNVTDIPYLLEGEIPINENGEWFYSFLPTSAEYVYVELVSGGEVYAEFYMPSGLLRSYNVPKDDEFLYNILSYRTWIYDQAIAVITACIQGDEDKASEWVAGILSTQYDDTTDFEGQWAFSYNTINGYPIDPYFRTGAQMWVLESLLFFIKTYPNSPIFNDVVDSITLGLDALIDDYWVDEAGLQQHSFRGGRGQYTGIYDDFDENYTVPWCSTEHNLDAYLVLKTAVELLPSNPDWVEKRNQLKASLFTNFWDSGNKRAYQGVHPSFYDTNHALDVGSWYSIAAWAAGEHTIARQALESTYPYRVTQDEITAYTAYKPQFGYPYATDSLWVEGSAGVMLAMLAQKNNDEARELFNNLWKLIRDDGFPYTTVIVPEYEMQDWSSLASTAWMIIGSRPSGFWDVENIEVDNAENLDITDNPAMILQHNDPLDYSFGKSFKSYSINLINSNRNNKVLGNLFNRNFNKKLVFDSILNIDNIEFIGKLLVQNTNERGARGQFISTAGTLWTDLLTKDLKEDFDWSEYDHRLTLTNQLYADQGILNEGDIRYDFIYRGDGLLKQELPHMIMRRIDMVERQPAIRLKAVLEKLFEGYEIEQNILPEEHYNRLYFLYCQNQTRNSSGWLRDAKANAFRNEYKEGGAYVADVDDKTWTHRFTGDILFNNVSENLYENGTEYVIPEDGAYRLSGNIYFDEVETLSNYFGELQLNFTNRKYIVRIDEFNESDEFIQRICEEEYEKDDKLNVLASFTDEDLTFSFNTHTKELRGGNKLKLYVLYEYTVNLEEIYADVIYKTHKTEEVEGENVLKLGASNFDIETWQGIGWGGVVTGKWIVPDMSVRELVEGILTMFNAEFYFSQEKRKVYIYNRFQSQPSVYDITSRVVKDSLYTSEEPEKFNYKFKYREDGGDLYAKESFEMLVDNGSYKVDRRVRETKTLELPFSYSVIRTIAPLILQMTDGYVDEESPEFKAGEVDRPNFTTNFNQRLAFYAGIVFYDTSIYSSAAQGTSLHIRQNVVNFSNSYTTHSLGFKNSEGLYNLYHRKNIERLERGKVLECDMILSPNFINNLYLLEEPDFRSVYAIRINGFDGVYQIIELENIKDNLYHVKLVDVLDYEDLIKGDFSDDFTEDFNT